VLLVREWLGGGEQFQFMKGLSEFLFYVNINITEGIMYGYRFVFQKTTP